MRNTTWLARLGSYFLALTTLLLVSACAPTTDTVGGSTGTAPTATPVPSCATALPGAGSASAGAHFTDVPFPTGAVSAAIATHLNVTGLWAIYEFDACAPSTTAAAVKSFFAAQLPAHGWAYAPTLPFDGGYQKACGDPYCWGKGDAPRYVGLEQVTDHAGGYATFHIRLFIPPPAPSCAGFMPSGIPLNPYRSFWDDAHTVPLPPLSRPGIGDGYANGGVTYMYSPFCSAGTAASITSFFNTELAALGWAHGTRPCNATAGWVKGNRLLLFTIPSATNWQMAEYDC